MKKLILFYILIGLQISCNQQLIISCDENNYFESPKSNHNNGFKNYNRELFTEFSEKELESLFNTTNISCKDILTTFFYCNICFNNNVNYLISYNGNRFDLQSVNDPNMFTNSVINLISSMTIGEEEYNTFLNSQKNNFSEDEKILIEQYFQEKKDTKIKSIKIQTH
ncbi:MAG: hypothetical protein CMP49_05380 [Flavobacteriales bacterium]|nr:hypothetical protein [Flavobacteriales bacterium]|tara:strand:+ start:1443 stop:1943 length:501 start_codon:yes stop_codon:yes gene_type:complete